MAGFLHNKRSQTMIINVPYHTVCYHFDLFSMLNLKLDPFLQILYTKTQILH